MRGRFWAALLLTASTAAVLTSPAPAQAGPSSGALTPQYEMNISVVGDQIGVPADAEAVMLNVTAVQPYGPGYFTVYPCGQTPPVTSNLNYADGTIAVPNAVVARVGDGGQVCLVTLRPADVIVDLVGYFPAGSAIEPLANPARVLDTRDGTGVPAGRMAAGGTATLTLRGTPSIPADAGAVVLNTTAVGTSGPGFVTVYPCESGLPLASNVNYDTAETRPNLVLAGLDSTGRTCLYTSAEADLVADAIAYLPSGSDTFTAIAAPVRILDTRDGTGAPLAPIGPGAPLTVHVSGAAGVPDDATSVVLNVAATRQAGPGFMAAHPCGAVPSNSTLNFVDEPAIANLAIVGIDERGDICLTASTSVDVLADVAGYFVGTSGYVSVAPIRLVDTRRFVQTRCLMFAWRESATSFVVRGDLSGIVTRLTSPLLADVTDLVITPECDGIITVGGFGGSVVRFGLDGSVTTLFTLPLGSSSPSNRLSVLDDGSIVVMSYSGAFDVETGTRLLFGSNAYRPIGMLPDRSAALFVSSLVGSFEVVFVGPMSNEIDRVPLPLFRGDPRLSSRGTFLAFGAPVRAEGSVVYDVPVIMDLDGVVLDVLEPEVPGPITLNWYDDDSVIVCSPGVAPRLWTIFNGATPIGGAPASSCPFGG